MGLSGFLRECMALSLKWKRMLYGKSLGRLEGCGKTPGV